MPDFAQQMGAATQLATALSGAAAPRPTAPNSTMQPAQATKGAVIPGSNGLRLTGNPEMDRLMLAEYTRYAELWGRKFAEMKRKYPDLTGDQIVAQIGPPPSQVSKLTDFIDRIGALETDPEVQKDELERQRDIEKFKLNRELMGEQAAITRTMEMLSSRNKIREQEAAASLAAKEGALNREFTAGENAKDLAERRADRTQRAGETARDYELRMKELDLRREGLEVDRDTAKANADLARANAENLRGKSADEAKKEKDKDVIQIQDIVIQAYTDRIVDIDSKIAELESQYIEAGKTDADIAKAIAPIKRYREQIIAPIKAQIDAYYKSNRIDAATKQVFYEMLGIKEPEVIDRAKPIPTDKNKSTPTPTDKNKSTPTPPVKDALSVPKPWDIKVKDDETKILNYYIKYFYNNEPYVDDPNYEEMAPRLQNIFKSKSTSEKYNILKRARMQAEILRGLEEEGKKKRREELQKEMDRLR